VSQLRHQIFFINRRALYPVYTRKHTWSKRIKNASARRVL